MEDFGYKKTNDSEKNPLLMKKIFLISATLLSLSAFVYITINAYYFINKNDSKKEIETIKGPESPIKVYEGGEYENKDNKVVDHSIYDDIFGNRKDILKEEIKINKSQEPAYPSESSKNSNNQKIIKENLDDSENLIKKIEDLSNQEIEKLPIAKENVKLAKPIENTDISSADTAKIKPKINKRNSIRVQISAMSSKENCEEHWKKLSGLYPEVFSGTKYFIEQVDLGRRGIFFRLQIGEFFNQVDAEEFCSHFVSKTQKTRSDCIVVE